MLEFATFITALGITIALIPPLSILARRMSVVDVPNERKVHSVAVPRIGGIAMVIGALIPILLWVPVENALGGVLLAVCVLLFFGAWDDSRDLDYRLKFVGQFTAAFLVVFVGGVKLAVFPFTGLDPVPDWLSIPVTIVFLVGATNAVNLSDGLDGLAAGISLLSLCGIGLFAYVAGGDAVVFICLAVAGVAFGFLRYNTFPARVFMGDTGSQFLGFMLGVMSIMLTQQVNPALNPVLPLFLLGIPVIDTLFVFSKRISEGRSPFSPDQNHIHHQLLRLGMAHYEAVSVIYASQIAFIAFAIMLRYEADLLVTTVYILLSAFMLGGLRLAQVLDWKIKQTRITNFVSGLEDNQRVKRLPTDIIGCAVPLYLLLSGAFVESISLDLAIGSVILFLVLLVRLVWANSLRFIPLRLLIFPAIAFSVYQIFSDQRASELLPFGVEVALSVALILVMLLAVRLAKKESFQTTPTDILVIVVAAGVGILYERNIVDVDYAPILVVLIMLFYAGELVMRQMRHSWNCLTVGMLFVLAQLSIKLAV